MKRGAAITALKWPHIHCQLYDVYIFIMGEDRSRGVGWGRSGSKPTQPSPTYPHTTLPTILSKNIFSKKKEQNNLLLISETNPIFTVACWEQKRACVYVGIADAVYGTSRNSKAEHWDCPRRSSSYHSRSHQHEDRSLQRMPSQFFSLQE